MVHSIYGSITTKKDLATHCDITIDIFNRIGTYFYDQLNNDLMILIYDTKGILKNWKYTEKNIDKAIEILKTQRPNTLQITDYIASKDFYSTNFNDRDRNKTVMTFDIGNPTRWESLGNTCDSIGFSFDIRLMKSSLSVSKVVNLFMEIFNHIDGINAFIANGSHVPTLGLMDTEFDRTYGIEPILNSIYYDERVRGYFWGNFLTDKHIDILGGIHSIKKNAPCFLVEDLSTENKRVVYLQLTENVAYYSNNQLAALREYLRPLFPPESEKRNKMGGSRTAFNQPNNKGAKFKIVDKNMDLE